MSLRCRFGIHRWSAWAWSLVARELLPGVWQKSQTRRCQRCGYPDTRWSSWEATT